MRELSAGDNSSIFSVAFSPTDNRLLAVGHGGQAADSYVALWDIDAGTELVRLPGATVLPDFPGDKDSRVGKDYRVVGALAFSHDGKYLVAGFGSKWLFFRGGFPFPLKVWEVANRRLIRLDGHTGFGSESAQPTSYQAAPRGLPPGVDHFYDPFRAFSQHATTALHLSNGPKRAALLPKSFPFPPSWHPLTPETLPRSAPLSPPELPLDASR